MPRKKKPTTTVTGSQTKAPVKKITPKIIVGEKGNGKTVFTEKINFVGDSRATEETAKVTGQFVSATEMNASLSHFREDIIQDAKKVMSNAGEAIDKHLEEVEKEMKVIRRSNRVAIGACVIVLALIGAAVYFFIKGSKELPA